MRKTQQWSMIKKNLNLADLDVLAIHQNVLRTMPCDLWLLTMKKIWKPEKKYDYTIHQEKIWKTSKDQKHFTTTRPHLSLSYSSSPHLAPQLRGQSSISSSRPQLWGQPHHWGHQDVASSLPTMMMSHIRCLNGIPWYQGQVSYIMDILIWSTTIVSRQVSLNLFWSSFSHIILHWQKIID